MVHGRTLLVLFSLMLPVYPTGTLFSQPADMNQADFEPLFHVKEKKSKFQLVEQFSKIIETDTRIAEARDFDSTIINVAPISVNRLRVSALKPGITTINIVDEQNQMFTVEVFVTGDVRHLQAYLTRLFPSSSVDAVEVQDAIVLRGWVTQPEHITEMIEIAEQFYPKVLNQMQVGGVQQVLLKVKVMEVQRTKARQMGFNFIFDGNDGFFTSTPGQLTPIAGIGMGGISVGGVADPTITFGIINSSSVFQGFLEALKTEGLLKIKAEPSLVTTNGRPATLLNGGEFPILVPQTLGVTTVQWREFGVNMSAVPIILGNGRLRLELQPEVSERDFSNSVQVGGIVVPGLTTRRVNTQVEMKFGQTLMLAGLISRRDTAATQKLPWLGEYPVIGTFFSRKRYEESETELIVLVTPEYVSPLEADTPVPGGPGDDTTVPTDKELYFDGMMELPKYGDPAYCAPKPPAQLNYCPPEMNSGYCPYPVPQHPGSLPPGHYESGSMVPAPMAPPAPSVDEIEPPALPSATELDLETEQVRRAAPFPPAPEKFWAEGIDEGNSAQAQDSAAKDVKRVSFKKVDSKTIRARGQWAPRTAQ